MSKTVTINQDKLLMLKETVASDSNITSHNDYCSELTEAAPEVDEYEIGDEGSNPPVGGNFYHVNEAYNVSVRGDLDSINTIEFIPHENAREEGYEDDEIEDFEPYYEVEAMDMDGNTILYADLTVEELFDYFPQSIINDIIERDKSNATRLSNPSINQYRIEDILYRDTTPSDVDNVDEVNRIAKKIQTGGPSAYLLTDGDIIYFHDHIYVNNIDGITPDKFIALGNIRLSNGGFELIKEPTRQQMYELKQWIRQQDGGIYVDFCEESHQTYPRTLFSTKYGSPNAERIVNDIYYYFEEGIKPQDNFYESKDKEKVLENFDFEVDSSEIDLSSFKKKHELVPNIWNPDGKLNSRIRLKLLDIADDFWEYVNLTWVKPSGIILTGSICNFNWSQYSDIDLHLIVDFDEIDEKIEFVKDYLDSKKNEWNNEHSGLQIMGYPVELYVQNLGEMPESNGIYDLEENDWVREPNPDDIKSIGLNKFSIKEKAAKIMTIIDDMYDALASTDDSHKIEQMGDDASYLWKKVKEMRKSSLEKNGESGSGNIVYKILRRTGYLDRLFKLSNVVYDKFNSITESTNVENIDIFSLAKERFGTTNDIRECGYVLPDGSMLDFSGRHMVTGDTDTSHLKGRRSVDHREIGDLNWDRDMTTRNNLNINMADFIRKGAIRIHCSNTWSSINLFVKPTKEQINPLLRLIQYSKGNVTVEIGDGDNSYEYAEWDEANPRRVINDVMRYFDGETINLVGNVRESIRKYSNAITLLKEEVVADGNSEHNPYKKRWEAERKALKDFICNFGKVMTSKENGKTYKVYYDKTLSQLIGYNYCICLQWDAVNLKPKSVLYIRALDKFTDKMFQANFDARGRDNMAGTYDDLSYQAQ